MVGTRKLHPHIGYFAYEKYSSVVPKSLLVSSYVLVAYLLRSWLTCILGQKYYLVPINIKINGQIQCQKSQVRCVQDICPRLHNDDHCVHYRMFEESWPPFLIRLHKKLTWSSRGKMCWSSESSLAHNIWEGVLVFIEVYFKLCKKFNLSIFRNSEAILYYTVWNLCLDDSERSIKDSRSLNHSTSWLLQEWCPYYRIALWGRRTCPLQRILSCCCSLLVVSSCRKFWRMEHLRMCCPLGFRCWWDHLPV